MCSVTPTLPNILLSGIGYVLCSASLERYSRFEGLPGTLHPQASQARSATPQASINSPQDLRDMLRDSGDEAEERRPLRSFAIPHGLAFATVSLPHRGSRDSGEAVSS